MNARELPSADAVRGMRRGSGRAAQIRFFRGQGCSLDEITTHLRIDAQEVRRTLLRPLPERVKRVRLVPCRFSGDLVRASR